MADFYPLISRAVAALEKNSGENRRAIYERARAALLALLRGATPPLSESDITRERLALEESIRKVEAESVRQFVEASRAAPSVPQFLDELERRHRALEAEIAEARAHPSIDNLQIVELKRHKLLVRDELARLLDEVDELSTQQPLAQVDDPDDAPEWTQEQFERADLYHGDKLIRRGRPRSENPKIALKLRIDPDVVEHFRATGPGWQTRINDTLRKAAKLPPWKQAGRGY